MRHKTKFAVFVECKPGSRTARNPSKAIQKPRILTTTGLHAFLGEFNRLKSRDITGFIVRRVATILISATLLAGCLPGYYQRSRSFVPNKQLQAHYLGYTWEGLGRATIHVLLKNGDTVHYFTTASRESLRRRQPGDPCTFIFDSTRHVIGDTLPGRLTFNY
jgi:hypothetical protein